MRVLPIGFIERFRLHRCFRIDRDCRVEDEQPTTAAEGGRYGLFQHGINQAAAEQSGDDHEIVKQLQSTRLPRHWW